jgi:predicted nicotinamide N-methyase
MYEYDEDIDYAVEQCVIGDYSFNITTIEFLPIEKLMVMHAQDKEVSGRKIWCGSLVVAEYLMRNASFVRDNIVVELGAGTGLLGMLAARLGAAYVYLSDHDTKSLQHMRNDCLSNNIIADIILLDWFTSDISMISNETAPLRIIAGDVLYKNNLIVPFMETTKKLLKRSNSLMLLCHVPRAGVTHEHVIFAAQNVGLEITSIDKDLWFNLETFSPHCSEQEMDTAGLYSLKGIW